VEDFDKLAKLITSLYSNDNIPNFNTWEETRGIKKVIGALATKASSPELVAEAKTRGFLLFIPDVTGFRELSGLDSWGSP